MKTNINNYVVALVLLVIIVALGFIFNSKTANNGVVATIGISSLVNLDNVASVGSVGGKEISWSSTNYPEKTEVNINLIRKISDSPQTFELVSTIAKNTENDGSEVWFSYPKENTENLYLEVTCATTIIPQGCIVASLPLAINQ